MPFGVEQRERAIDLDGARTSVRDTAAQPVTALPIEIDASPDARPIVDAAVAAVLSRRVLAPVPGRTARIVVAPAAPRASTSAAARAHAAVTVPWIAAAIARITDDPDLQRTDANGQPVVIATTDGTRLIVTSTARAVDPITALAVRAVFSALAAQASPVATAASPPQGSSEPSRSDARRSPASPRVRPSSPGDAGDTAPPSAGRNGVEDSRGDPRHSNNPRRANASPGPSLADRETLAIPDVDLRAWERPASDVRLEQSTLSSIEHDDRRWLWAAVVALLAVETWLRRSRRDGTAAEEREDARVA
jgi:hypothetical protein